MSMKLMCVCGSEIPSVGVDNKEDGYGECHLVFTYCEDCRQDWYTKDIDGHEWDQDTLKAELVELNNSYGINLKLTN